MNDKCRTRPAVLMFHVSGKFLAAKVNPLFVRAVAADFVGFA